MSKFSFIALKAAGVCWNIYSNSAGDTSCVLAITGMGVFILIWCSNTDNLFGAIFTQDAQLIIVQQQVASSS